MPTEVNFYNEPNSPYTALEVITPDRQGLLAIIGYILIDHKLLLRKAKIATLGERVEDIFFVTDARWRPIDDKALLEEVAEEIRSQLDAWNDATQTPITQMTL